MADIVEDFITRLQAIVPNMPPTDLSSLERSIRHDYGGTEPYVGKRMSKVTRTTLLAHGLQQKKPLKEVFAYASVSRRTGFRLLNQKAN